MSRPPGEPSHRAKCPASRPRRTGAPPGDIDLLAAAFGTIAAAARAASAYAGQHRSIDEVITVAIHSWRDRLLEKLEAATLAHPPAVAVDLPSLADQVFTTFEGGFILARALNDPDGLRRQLAHTRKYISLLFGGSSETAARVTAAAAGA